ncbi:MAG: 2-hydroxy-3-oxopropionate reductase [Alphaproteobacteria bacterium]|nr:2-hydroxy-3-oxopropionate reductase [Alphaproteobacteria bacterium]
MTERLGFIGPGIMGLPMAMNLRRAGHGISVYARSKDKAAPLFDEGAAFCSSPKEVAEKSDIVFICVSDTPDVDEVIFGANGLVHGAKPGGVIVDMSTISPESTRRFALELEKKNIDMLDAPISGGEGGAIAGTLSIMVGGKPEVFERVKPYFEVMGKNIVLVGDNGAGQVTKSCNQVVVAVTIEGVAEALKLAEKSGVDGKKVREALLGGFAGSKILEVHGKRMLEGDYKPGFMARLHRKDMGIVLDAAAKLGLDLPAATLATLNLDAVIKNGDGALDSAAIFRVLGKD